MRYLFIEIVVLLLLCGALFAETDDPQARAIMEKVDARDDGDNRTADMEMVLIDRYGKQRVRAIRSFSKDKGDDILSLMFFTRPADVEGTGFLSWDYDDSRKDDGQWLYLPALKKTKRIASHDKSGSFMGSDFSYSDMTKPNLDDYFYHLQNEMRVGEHPVWVIEALPRAQQVIDKTGYSKSLLLVRQDNYVVVRSVDWVDGRQDLKYMDIKRLELIDGIWIGTEVHMTTKRGEETRHKTILKLSKVKFNQPLTEDFFSVRQVEKGL